MKLVIAIILLVCVSLSASSPLSKLLSKGLAGRITGGQETKAHAFPYQIALSLRKTYGITTLCGGSLVSDQFILTAAHCLEDVRFGFAFFGAHDLRKGGLRIKFEAKNFFVHSEFNKTSLNNDIAMIKLDEPIHLNDKIQLIQLPSSNDGKIDETGTVAIASGWGKYTDKSQFTSNVLRFVDLVILDYDSCLKFYSENVIRKENICTNGSSGKSTCSGDSGGPLVITNARSEKIQIGISSFGSRKGCEKGFPAVFTKITMFLDWIAETMRR